MLRPIAFLRHLAPLLIVVPVGIAACSDDESSDNPGTGVNDAGGTRNEAGTDSGRGNDGAPGNDGSVTPTPDTTPPAVLSSYPAAGGTGISTTAELTVDFSERMAPSSLTAAGTFKVAQGTTPVAGTVSYFENTATFVPASALALGTPYTATITTAAKDLAGNALAGAHTWMFTTDATPPLGPPPVLLGASGKYVILAESAISNVPTSKITGNIALSPAAASYITGFADMAKAGTKWTSVQVIGGIFAADNDPPTPDDLTTAVGSMHTAYTDAAGRPTPDFLDHDNGAIGPTPLVPGLYKWTTDVTIPGDISIAGKANDVWIFQISGNLMMSSAKNMTLAGGARAKNVFWQVAGAVDLGTTSHAEGIILSKTAIVLGTGATINGRLHAQTAVTLGASTVTAPAQ